MALLDLVGELTGTVPGLSPILAALSCSVPHFLVGDLCVAGAANCFAVAKEQPQFRECRPWFYMVRVEASTSLMATLAGIVISLKNSFAPLAMFNPRDSSLALGRLPAAPQMRIWSALVQAWLAWTTLARACFWRWRFSCRVDFGTMVLPTIRTDTTTRAETVCRMTFVEWLLTPVTFWRRST